MSFTVILNGCSIIAKDSGSSIRDQFKINPADFVFAFIGNINPRKNQVQVVNAFEELPESIRKTTKVIFVGGGDVDLLKQYIDRKGLSYALKVVGTVPKEKVHNYYMAADATILTSISEGFGLSVIEGYVYGKPTVVFDDLAAYSDICNSETSIGVSVRTDRDLAEGMMKCINKKWNHSYISRFSQNFSFDKMASDYINLYRRISRGI